MLGHAGRGHPDHAPGVGLPRVGGHAFEDGAVARVVEHLHLAHEIFKAGGRAELRVHRAHVKRHATALVLVLVVMRPGVADGPVIGRGDKGFQLSIVWMLGMPSSTLRPRLMRQ